MVESQLRQRGIRDERLLAAMSKVPRHEFVSQQNWKEAYADHPIPIAEKQTTSQPYMIAAMVQAAQIKPEDRVLEIGAGSGYQTAVLAELATPGVCRGAICVADGSSTENFGTAGLSQCQNRNRRWFTRSAGSRAF